jgi:hypothetical protein
LRDAYLAVITNFVQLLRIAWVWALSSALFEELIVRLFGIPLFKGSELEKGFIAVAILVLTDVLAGASIAVAWHRLLLRNERSPSRIYFRLDRLVRRYFAGVLMLLIVWLVFAFLFLVFLLGLIFVGVVVLGVFGVVAPDISEATVDSISVVALSVAATVATVPTSCLSILLPTRALERTASFGDAWRSTRSNRWRITIGTLLTCAPPLLLMVLSSEIASRVGISHAHWGWTATNTILGMLLDVVYVGFLSYTYRHLLA